MSTAAIEPADDGYQFGYEIAVYASERAARLRATISDPVALAAEIERQVEAPATRARRLRLADLRREGMLLSDAVAWSEAALRGHCERMGEHEPVH